MKAEINMFPCRGRDCGKPVPVKRLDKGPTFCFCSERCFNRFKATHDPVEAEGELILYRDTILNTLTRKESVGAVNWHPPGGRLLGVPRGRNLDPAYMLSEDAPSGCKDFLAMLRDARRPGAKREHNGMYRTDMAGQECRNIRACAR